MTLNQLAVGQKALIQTLNLHHPGATRLAEMGLIPGEIVTFIGKGPLGDPYRIKIMDYELCLRAQDAAAVGIQPIPTDSHR